LKQRIADTEKTNREYRKTIESTNIHERQKRYVIIDKFLRLLNTKKLKIYQLQQQVQQLKRRLDNNEDSDEDLSVIESSTSMDINRKKQIIMQTEKTTRSTVASKGKRPLRNDEYEVDFENEWEIENESKYEERVVVEEDFIVAGPSTNPVIKKQKVRHTNE
jgi:acetyl-CoA carboxylase alpha subunit